MLRLYINVTKKLNSDLIIAANNVIKTDSINLINTFMSQNIASHFVLPAASVAFSLFAASSFDTIQKSAYSAITAQIEIEPDSLESQTSVPRVLVNSISSIDNFRRRSFNCYKTAGAGYGTVQAIFCLKSEDHWTIT